MFDYKFELESPFSPGTNNRVWHAGIVSPRPEAFKEMEINVYVRGVQTGQFMVYAIKSGIAAGGREFSYNFQDYAAVPFDGTGDEIKLTCTLTYDVAK